MWFVLLSVICSVTVGIFLKVAKRFQLNIFQIITFNYFSALLLTYFTYQPELTFKEKTIPYSLYIGLAILLPIVFLIATSKGAYRFSDCQGFPFSKLYLKVPLFGNK